MILVKCPMCSNDVSPNAISCPHCGEPLGRQNDNTFNTENQQKSICLVCKGRGKVRSPLKIIMGLVGLFLIWTVGVYFVLHEEGEAIGLIFTSIAVGGWGFSRVKCKVCKGRGSIGL